MKTIVGLFDDFAQAERAVQDLQNAGIPRDDISLVANNASGQYDQYATRTGTTDNTVQAVETDAAAGATVGGIVGLLMGLGLFVIPGFGPIAAAGWLASLLTGAGIGAVAGGIIGALTHIGVPAEDAAYYNEGIRRGGTLLAVKAADEVAPRVAQILSSDGAVDIDQRGAQWRQEGFLPTPQTAATTTSPAPAAAPPVTAQPMTAQTAKVNANQETALPVIEEEIQVGKRAVERGGVRVYSHIVETPVTENVNLREEHVTVERRPVDRPINPQELSTFKEGTIEVTEMAEEAVIAKQARVVEEVVVGKEATQRTETVQDTVRRTEVEVEPIAGTQHVSRTAADFDTYRTDFRNNWQTNYANQGGTYEQYEPAYRYGYDMANNAAYRGRNWSDIEPTIQQDWNTRYPNTWDRMKNSVRYAWDKTTGAERGGIQTGGRDIDGTPDTRGIMEKTADTLTGDRIDDKTGKPVR